MATIVHGQDGDYLFTLVSPDPVISRGTIQYTDPGAVVFHNGMFHMFYNSFDGWPATVNILYATSEDGLTWTKLGDEPVIANDAVAYAGFTFLASSALVEDDGTWVLYFYTWDSRSNFAKTQIGRAIAPEPRGPWTVDPAPALTPGPAGAWDAHQVAAPSVIKVDGVYTMYYTGASQQNDLAIGLARSEDGITWQRNNDPATADAPFAESDPIVSVEQGSVWQPRVLATPDGIVMLLKSGEHFYDGAAIVTYLISDDGADWSLVSNVAVTSAQEVSGGRAIWFTDLLYQDGTYYLFLEIGLGGTTEVFLATYEGELDQLVEQ